MISIFEIFSIGIGPSSSHTVGPMRAAKSFLDNLAIAGLTEKVKTIKCDFYGSLGLTGKGHGSDKAFLLGIQGYRPETIESDKIPEIILRVSNEKSIFLSETTEINFNLKNDIKFHRRVSLPEHPNALAIAAFDNENKELSRKVYFSLGGGFIKEESDFKQQQNLHSDIVETKYPFTSAKQLLKISRDSNLKISQIVYQNELSFFTDDHIKSGLNTIWDVMQNCVKRGLKNKGILPGGLKVKRRAPEIFKKLNSLSKEKLSDSLIVLDWVNLYAIAVNEENADGGQVVTAPTNGAAGIIPAVLHYFINFCPEANQEKVHEFLLTAAAIGFLYKTNASISGAEVGCQGEVGVACSMAAGALCEVLGGTPEQVANAAEVAMEHNLGLTCDPIGGLVQIPCIERNAMGAVKAINSARIALQGDGSHFVSLDKVIETMYQTGKDMRKQYKETSKGGLAVNLTEC